MSTTQKTVIAAAGLVTLGVYSVIMTTTDGEAASWAWLLLLASAALFVSPALIAKTQGSVRDDG